MLRRHVPSAYRPVLANRVFRRLILGFAVSSLLHAWGSAGKYTLLAELLPEEQPV